MKDQAQIYNTTIEAMFLRIATDQQVETYFGHVEKGRIGLATAYASRIAFKEFIRLVSQDDRIMRSAGIIKQ